MPVSSSRTAGTGSTVCLVVVFVCLFWPAKSSKGWINTGNGTGQLKKIRRVNKYSKVQAHCSQALNCDPQNLEASIGQCLGLAINHGKLFYTLTFLVGKLLTFYSTSNSTITLLL